MASPFTTTDHHFDAMIQRREADEDRRVAEYKMNRDMASIRRPAAASPGSVSYLHDLMVEKAVKNGSDANAAERRINAWLAVGRTQKVVSENIDRLKAEGFTGRVKTASSTFGTADLPSAEIVPEGRYALMIEHSEVGNDIAFYKVDRPTEGKWAGRVFVKLITGGGGEQRLSWAVTKNVLSRIAEEGAAVASARYGHELDHCGVCGRELTNKASRDRGIGPDCFAKMGW
jgi:hypothetical protein